MRMEDVGSEGLKLLKKGQKGIIHAVFSRMGLIIVLLLLQILLLFGLFRRFAELMPQYLGGTILFSGIIVLCLLNSRIDPSAKITWLVLIMLLPVFGTLFLLFTQSEFGHRVLKARMKQLISETKNSILQPASVFTQLSAENEGAASLVRYVNRSGCYPVYDNTKATFFPLGEDKFAELLRQLTQAEHFIFLEYFIVDEGLMWGKILEILARKAAEGVEVRVMYDGTCEFALLPRDYPKRLKKLGIQCKVFSHVIPVVSTHFNYRDHRKILVIDGHTAFTGGVNLSDEYINHVKKYGHWKDTAVMLQGEAAKSCTLMFLQMWNITEKTPEFDKYLSYAPVIHKEAKGYVMPFGDCPLDDDKVGERLYMDILNRAQKYVHIMSPYLILDGEMETALKFAAERGVDVSIILPGIPDKSLPYALAKTHYASLLDSGIRLYEYTPGFVHAKLFVSDDREAVVGTINLDYRSLYHHFECAAWMYDTDCISHIEADFVTTRGKCREVTKETIWQGKKYLKPVGFVLKAIAPLL